MVTLESTPMRAKIKQEATRLFVQQGYLGISMREIGAACGISKAGLYYHFADKEQLLLEILNDYLDELASLMERICLDCASSRTRISQLIEAIFAQPSEKRGLIRLASQEMGHLSAHNQASLGVVYAAKFTGRIESFLADGIQRGEFKMMDTRLATWIVLGMMYPFFAPGQNSTRRQEKAAIDLMLSVLFDGITNDEHNDNLE